jgi:hypothetical protein
VQPAGTHNDETAPARPASRRRGRLAAAAVTLTALALAGAGPAAAADLMPGPSAIGPEFGPAAAADVVPGPGAIGPEVSHPFEPNAVGLEV